MSDDLRSRGDFNDLVDVLADGFPGYARADYERVARSVLPLVREAQAEAWARGVEDLAAVFKGPIGATRELNNPYRETP